MDSIVFRCNSDIANELRSRGTYVLRGFLHPMLVERMLEAGVPLSLGYMIVFGHFGSNNVCINNGSLGWVSVTF